MVPGTVSSSAKPWLKRKKDLFYEFLCCEIWYDRSKLEPKMCSRKGTEMANREVLVRGRLTNLAEREFKNDDGTSVTRRVATLVFDKDEFSSQADAIKLPSRKLWLRSLAR